MANITAITRLVTIFFLSPPFQIKRNLDLKNVFQLFIGIITKVQNKIDIFAEMKAKKSLLRFQKNC